MIMSQLIIIHGPHLDFNSNKQTNTQLLDNCVNVNTVWVLGDTEELF